MSEIRDVAEQIAIPAGEFDEIVVKAQEAVAGLETAREHLESVADAIAEYNEAVDDARRAAAALAALIRPHNQRIRGVLAALPVGLDEAKVQALLSWAGTLRQAEREADALQLSLVALDGPSEEDGVPSEEETEQLIAVAEDTTVSHDPRLTSFRELRDDVFDADDLDGGGAWRGDDDEDDEDDSEDDEDDENEDEDDEDDAVAEGSDDEEDEDVSSSA